MAGKGWHERKQPIITPKGIKNKALIHRMVAAKKGLERTLRKPMVRREPKWTDETIIEELKKIRAELGHFPTAKKLGVIGRNDLVHAMGEHGGFNKFRTLLKEKIIYVDVGFWTDETVIEELKKVRTELGYFPSDSELRAMDRSGLTHAISKRGGFNKFRTLLKEEIIQVDAGFWTDETATEELKKVRTELGHFPSDSELRVIGRGDLANAISRYGSMNIFRTLLGEEITKVGAGFWTDETITKKLKSVRAELGHFPTQRELVTMGEKGLTHGIFKHGGMNKFRKALGYSVSMFEQHRSDVMSYSYKRGKKTEQMVMNILEEWCNEHEKPLPSYNVKLTKGKVIEFVCNAGKKIGIDVTNTKSKGNVHHKWSRKKYQKHLDELWVVVFSDVFTKEDYDAWNDESPDSVKVLSIYEFLEELDYAADNALRCKIEKYCACSFRTKEQLKQHRQQHRQMFIEDLL